MFGWRSISSLRSAAQTEKTTANRAVFRNEAPERHSTPQMMATITTLAQSDADMAVEGRVLNGAKPVASADEMPAAMPMAPPTDAVRLNPISARAAANAPAAPATAASVERGGKTTAAGARVRRSNITPSSRGSEGPGTSVRDARMAMTAPRLSGRAGMVTVRWLKSGPAGASRAGLHRHRTRAPGCPLAPACRLEPAHRGSIQRADRDLAAAGPLLGSLHANVRPDALSRSGG